MLYSTIVYLCLVSKHYQRNDWYLVVGRVSIAGLYIGFRTSGTAAAAAAWESSLIICPNPSNWLDVSVCTLERAPPVCTMTITTTLIMMTSRRTRSHVIWSASSVRHQCGWRRQSLASTASTLIPRRGLGLECSGRVTGSRYICIYVCIYIYIYIYIQGHRRQMDERTGTLTLTMTCYDDFFAVWQ